jgi:parvulin-like peptidyl-prolyl isomerase
MINGISVAVDNEPITLFEIYKEVAEKSIAYDEAVENLIEKKIRLIEVKKEGIHIDDFELNKELESIATQNRLSLYQFRILLEDKGIDFNEYKDRLKEKLSLEKLDKKIAYRKLKEIDEEELQSYYNSHLDEFSIAKTFKVVKYEASSKELLESVVSNPMFKPNGVSREHLTLEADKINPRLSIVLNETLEVVSL